MLCLTCIFPSSLISVHESYLICSSMLRCVARGLWGKCLSEERASDRFVSREARIEASVSSSVLGDHSFTLFVQQSFDPCLVRSRVRTWLHEAFRSRLHSMKRRAMVKGHCMLRDARMSSHSPVCVQRRCAHVRERKELLGRCALFDVSSSLACCITLSLTLSLSVSLFPYLHACLPRALARSLAPSPTSRNSSLTFSVTSPPTPSHTLIGPIAEPLTRSRSLKQTQRSHTHSILIDPTTTHAQQTGKRIT